MKNRLIKFLTNVLFFSAVVISYASINSAIAAPDTTITIVPASMPAIGKVDQRFQSYNVETVEVTGGNFWAPYPKPGEAPSKSVAGPHGTEFATNAYKKRDPIDLRSNKCLRMLTMELGPAYMRVSGSWANSIYFQDDDKPAMAPPPGYQGVITREQWAGVIEFGKAVDAKILTSFAVSEGARNADGSWNSEQARRLFAYTKTLGGQIDSVELMNEPNVSRTVYEASAYARDQAALQALVESGSPQTLLVGPSSTGEAGFKLFANPPEQMSTTRLLSGTPKPKFDVFSHHFYGAVSQRCKSLGERSKTEVTTSSADALSESWLARADQAQTFYRSMRDQFAPGAPIWITETAQTACGGDPWSATFLDTFRYLDQLARLAKQDVSIVFHNTLAASDYALIDDVTWQPQPNYWAALLWRRLMGEVVLEAGQKQGGLHVYAHCQRGIPGGVTVLAINLQNSAASLRIPGPAEIYALSSPELQSKTVLLNGKPLELDAGDKLPALTPTSVKAGNVTLAPTSISFIVLPKAKNASCPG